MVWVGKPQVVVYQETNVEQYMATYGMGGRPLVVYQKTYVKQYVVTYGMGGGGGGGGVDHNLWFTQKHTYNNTWQHNSWEVDHKLWSTKKYM